MSRAFRNVERAFALVGLATTAAVGTLSYVAYSYRKELEKVCREEVLHSTVTSRKKLPKAFILHLNLDEVSISDTSGTRRWDAMFEPGVCSIALRTVVESLQSARDDKRVKGLFATGFDGVRGMACIQELREALCKFHEVNKRHQSVFFTETFGDGTNQTLAYYLASAFDKIYMQPSGYVCTTGFSLHTPFFKDLLERWQLEFRVWSKERFKTAFNPFTEVTFTEEHRQQMSSLLEGIYEEVVSGIAVGRGMSKQQAESLISRAPLTAQEARADGFVDALMYKDDIWSVAELKDDPLPRVSIYDYCRALEHKKKDTSHAKDKPHVAVLRLSGHMSSQLGSRPDRRSNINSRDVNRELLDLEKNPNVKAVVIRMNSSGGSAVAADAIYKRISKLREAGKYVVMSMGDVAASGGYYAALGANTIMANPGTVTGSIGVISGSLGVRNALEAWGVHVETLKKGENAAMLSPFTEVTQEQEHVVEKLMTKVYDDFKNAVQERRGMTTEEVQACAQGRIWLGKEALQLNLIDALGGLSDAVALAKAKVDLPPDAAVVEYPSLHPVLDLIMTFFRSLGSAEAQGFPVPPFFRSSIEFYSLDAETVSAQLCADEQRPS